MTAPQPNVTEPSAGERIPEWTLGDRLRKVRRLLGLSQSDMSAQLGENQKTYAAWELDTSMPRNPMTVARRIEGMSGVPAAWILGVDVPFLSLAPQANNRRPRAHTAVITKEYSIVSDATIIPFPQVSARDTDPGPLHMETFGQASENRAFAS